MLPVSNQFKSNSSLLPKQNLSFGKWQHFCYH
jgi:hypothetical protein